VALLVSSASAFAQPVSVVHDKGLLTVQATNAPLASVFESIRSQAGIELILEDDARSTHLTANLTQVPVAMAIQRLLEGTGVSYIVMMDPSDWGRVGKVFVGGGGGGESGRTARAPRRPGPSAPEPDTAEMEEALDSGDQEVFDEATEALDAMDAGIDGSNMSGIDPNLENPGLETPPDEQGEFGGDFANPPGSSPIPDYLPPAQSFPRSNFTPGLPNGNNRRTQGGMTQGGMAQPQEENPANPPQATYPFTDPFGRPIPVPPGMTTTQQQQQQQRRQQQQQQQ
jgi:hypothetical protein